MRYEFIAVDIQNEFISGKPCITFIKEVFFPFLKEKNIKVNEIISDYRQPRPGDAGDGCHPGTWEYESIIPNDLRKSLWVKSMNSPIWIRENIGEKEKEPGIPYPDSEKFKKWLEENIGSPTEVIPVIFGLTIDCCVLSTTQELRWRGYEPIIIKEAVDHASGKEEDKQAVLEKSALRWWARSMSWEEFKQEYI